MTTLTLTPTFPVENEEVALTFASTPNSTFVIEITAVPSESAITNGFLTTALDVDNQTIGQTNAQAIVDDDLISNTFTPDVGGEYDITVYEFREVVGFTQGHDADPNADARFDLKAVSTFVASLGVVVGANMDLPLLTSDGEGATLRFNVSDVIVRVATIVDAVTEKSRVAALQTSVTAALAAIIGSAVSVLGTDLIAGTNDVSDEYERHRQLTVGPVHVNGDTTNVVDLGDADSLDGAIALLNELQLKIVRHLTDSASATTNWHVGGVDDLLNLPLAAPAADLASATVLLADMRERVYERHRVQIANPSAHTTADSTNDLDDDPTLLDDIIVAYFDALADDTPTAPDNEPQGVTDLSHRFGFTRFTEDTT